MFDLCMCVYENYVFVCWMCLSVSCVVDVIVGDVVIVMVSFFCFFVVLSLFTISTQLFFISSIPQPSRVFVCFIDVCVYFSAMQFL